MTFPEAMRRFGLDGDRLEPLAADFRKGANGRRGGVVKLVAGILGLSFDDLARRDAQRRLRDLTIVSAASLVCIAVIGRADKLGDRAAK